MFSPYRNKDKDLISEFQSYKERYKSIEDAIEQERVKFEPFSKQVDEAAIHIHEEADMQDAWDSVAPVTEDIDGITDHSITCC